MQKIKPPIQFDDFMKIDIRVVEIVEAEDIPESEKLVKLILDLGEERRQVLAGIKKWFKPEELVGKRTVYLANLEPRKMMGMESQGMILAVSSSTDESDPDLPVLLVPEGEVNPGDMVH